MAKQAIKAPQQMELSFGPYQFTRSGLVVRGESSQAQWELCGEGLKAVDEARQWAIGDWLCDGKRHHGDGLYKRAAKITNLDEGYLSKQRCLSDQFEISNRLPNLSWKHHFEVASVYPIVELKNGKLALGDEPDMEKIAELLKDAEAKGWPVSELREQVRQYKEWQREHIRLANEPDKYDVIYADPPWQYNSGDQHSDEEQHTVLSDHYPSMPLAEICKLPVSKMASSDAMLFLWCTTPTLSEALQVINAWGFEYKAQFVWDKISHNVGHYNSVRHELLLICTRGQPPKVPKLVDSVYSEERKEHSKKPAYFRKLIDELYPSGKRIEMFARDKSKGWEVWGNEC